MDKCSKCQMDMTDGMCSGCDMAEADCVCLPAEADVETPEKEPEM